MPDRAEQSRAEQSRAEQSRAEQSRAEQSRAEQSRAEQGLKTHHWHQERECQKVVFTLQCLIKVINNLKRPLKGEERSYLVNLHGR